MASLNTLRTKFGVVLSIVIALALLAFILSLKTEMGFSGNDPKVGVIDGDKINYSEYYEQYERVKAQSGAQGIYNLLGTVAAGVGAEVPGSILRHPVGQGKVGILLF